MPREHIEVTSAPVEKHKKVDWLAIGLIIAFIIIVIMVILAPCLISRIKRSESDSLKIEKLKLEIEFKKLQIEQQKQK